VGAQVIVVVDHVARTHRAVRARAAYEQADLHPATQPLIAEDRVGEAPGLIARERVHRVEHDRLDAGLAGLSRAQGVVEQREHEALGLAAAGAGGDQRCARLLASARQPLPREELVQVRRVRRDDIERRGHARGRGRERERDAQVRALEHALRAAQELEERGLEPAIGERPRAPQVVEEGGAELACDDPGDHAVSMVARGPRLLLRGINAA
jgi:hypothetical protein